MEFLEKELYALKGAIREKNFAQEVLQESYSWLSNVPKGQRTGELDKLQAEICYLLARDLTRSSRQLAKKYAEEAITLYERLNIESLEEAAPIFWEKLPDQMHEGVVKYTLQELCNKKDVDNR